MKSAETKCFPSVLTFSFFIFLKDLHKTHALLIHIYKQILNLFRGTYSEEAFGSLLQGFTTVCQYKAADNEKFLAEFSIKSKGKESVQVLKFYM